MIGFQFPSEFILHVIEIILFNCPVQGIGITGVKVYSSFLFPQFFNTATTLLVTYNSTSGDNCQSVSTIYIPIQPPVVSRSDQYFIELLFTDDSSVHQLSWLYLGEVRFNDGTDTPTEGKN